MTITMELEEYEEIKAKLEDYESLKKLLAAMTNSPMVIEDTTDYENIEVRVIDGNIALYDQLKNTIMSIPSPKILVINSNNRCTNVGILTNVRFGNNECVIRIKITTPNASMISTSMICFCNDVGQVFLKSQIKI
jgi:hypothetical protein